MAMGIVSDKEFDKALNDVTPSPNLPTVEIKQIERGRGEGNVQVPDGLRKIIGEESAIQGRASGLEIANNFGISPSSVSAYSQGARSTATMEQTPDKGNIDAAKLRVAKKARNRLMMALNNLTEEKIASAKAKDIAGVAKDMSAVIKSMEPEGPKNQGNNGPTFIFYSPHFKREEHFDVVHVKE